jgi:hypothetical protein
VFPFVLSPPRRNPDADGEPVFDLIVLGVGPDGHVASLFPNRPELAATGSWVLPVSGSPKPPPERISLALHVINAAKEVMVIALGEGKAEIVQRALEVRGQGGGGGGWGWLGQSTLAGAWRGLESPPTLPPRPAPAPAGAGAAGRAAGAAGAAKGRPRALGA